jgi:hypothetical protein
VPSLYTSTIHSPLHPFALNTFNSSYFPNGTRQQFIAMQISGRMVASNALIFSVLLNFIVDIFFPQTSCFSHSVNCIQVIYYTTYEHFGFWDDHIIHTHTHILLDQFTSHHLQYIYWRMSTGRPRRGRKIMLQIYHESCPLLQTEFCSWC